MMVFLPFTEGRRERRKRRERERRRQKRLRQPFELCARYVDNVTGKVTYTQVHECDVLKAHGVLYYTIEFICTGETTGKVTVTNGDMYLVPVKQHRDINILIYHKSIQVTMIVYEFAYLKLSNNGERFIDRMKSSYTATANGIEYTMHPTYGKAKFVRHVM